MQPSNWKTCGWTFFFPLRASDIVSSRSLLLAWSDSLEKKLSHLHRVVCVCVRACARWGWVQYADELDSSHSGTELVKKD